MSAGWDAFEGRPEPGLVAVDVDGTLIQDGEVNERLVEWIREQVAAGLEVMIWSARGKAAAEDARARAGLEELVPVVMSKPRLVVDDHGWGWVRFCRAIHPRAIGGEHE